MKKLSNISLKEFRDALTRLGLSKLRTKGGHEVWMKDGLTRPVIFQNHVEPIPELVVRTCLRTMGISKDDFLSLLEK